MKFTKRAIALAALALLAGAGPVLLEAQQKVSEKRAVAASKPAAERVPDPAARNYTALKRQLELFETVLNKALEQKFEKPFGILTESKGAYLEGYGAVFSVEVNLYPLRWISPFTPTPYSEKELRETRERKLQRVREIQELLADVLRDYGAGLAALRPDERVAIVVHLFNMEAERDMPTQLVLQAQHQAVLEALGQKLTAAEFRQKVSAVTF